MMMMMMMMIPDKTDENAENPQSGLFVP
jgi:hypothetical protein